MIGLPPELALPFDVLPRHCLSEIPVTRSGSSLAVRLLTTALLLSGGGSAALAQAPAISSVAPRGLAPGQQINVVVRGERLVGAKALWTSFPADVALAMIDKNGTEAGQVTFQITPKAEAPLGIHGLRILTPGGVSPIYPVMIDTLPVVAETGTHNTPATAQEITLPCAVEGTADSLGRDFFRFTARKGETISFEVFARRLGSPLDPSLVIHRADGKQITYCDDALGLSSDCQLAFTAPADGTFLAEVRDIRFQGGGNHAYRLRAGHFPLINRVVPSAVQKGQPGTIQPAGSLVKDIPAATVPAGDSPWLGVRFRASDAAADGFTWVSVVDSPVFTEQEPNNAPAEAKPIPGAPAALCEVHGRFDAAGDVDRFVIDAKAQQRVMIRGITRQEGWPTDLNLRVLNKDGGQVAAAEDQGTDEGLINYTFPADGPYTLEVTELLGRGGPEFGYRLEVEPYAPGFALQASTESVTIPAGGVVPVTVQATRLDYGGAIDLEAVGLPQGVTSVATRIGPGINSAVLTLQAAKDAPQANLSIVRIVGKAKIGDRDVQSVAGLGNALKAKWSGVKVVPPFAAEEIALAVAPASKLSLRVEPAEVVFGPELKAKVKIIAERGEGIDEAITLATEPAKDAVPGTITIAPKPIEKGKNEVEIELTGGEKAPLGPFTLVFLGTHKKGNDTTTAHTPGVGLKLEGAFKVQVDGNPKKIAKGAELPVKVQVQRNPAYQGEIKLTVDKLPKGVTAAEVVIPADKSEGDLVLKAAADAMPGEAKEVAIQAVSPANAKLKATAPLPGIVVE